MKNSNLITILFFMVFLGACHQETDIPEPLAEVQGESNISTLQQSSGQVLLSGLISPVGVEAVKSLNGLLICEVGSGNNDGTVSLLRNGKKRVLVDNLPSALRPDGNPEGTTHAAFHRGTVYIVNGLSGRLYFLNVQRTTLSHPISADDLPSQDIRAFVFGSGFTDSNIYKIVFDQRGNGYITDSGANILVKRAQQGGLQIFTKFPLVNGVEAVPTGIDYDGNRLLVSAFGGFPFSDESSGVFVVNRAGSIIDFRDGYSTLIDLEIAGRRPFALSLGTFGDTGFLPNSGELVRVTPQGPVSLVGGLNFPNGLEVIGNKVFITSLADGTLTLYTL